MKNYSKAIESAQHRSLTLSERSESQKDSLYYTPSAFQTNINQNMTEFLQNEDYGFKLSIDSSSSMKFEQIISSESNLGSLERLQQQIGSTSNSHA